MSSNRTMAERPPPFEDPGRGLEDPGGRVGRAAAAGGELGRRPAPVSREDEDRNRADVQAEEDVVRLVADHIGRAKVEPELALGAKGQAGPRLGAGTAGAGRPLPAGRAGATPA